MPGDYSVIIFGWRGEGAYSRGCEDGLEGGCMFGTQKPWLEVYRGHIEPEAEIFEGSL